MDTVDDLRDFWQRNNHPETIAPALLKNEMEKLIQSRIKKEKKAIAGYFWLSFCFQIVLYSFACYLIIRYWKDHQIVKLSACGILLYVPFTYMLLKKFKAMYKPRVEDSMDIHADISHQRRLLKEFFHFKKIFDLLSIPVTSIILTGILLQIYVPGGISAHIEGGIITGLFMILVYGVAAWFENKKHFVTPLRRLEMILEDLEKES